VAFFRRVAKGDCRSGVSECAPAAEEEEEQAEVA